jgi:hypothetical protein
MENLRVIVKKGNGLQILDKEMRPDTLLCEVGLEACNKNEAVWLFGVYDFFAESADSGFQFEGRSTMELSEIMEILGSNSALLELTFYHYKEQKERSLNVEIKTNFGDVFSIVLSLTDTLAFVWFRVNEYLKNASSLRGEYVGDCFYSEDISERMLPKMVLADLISYPIDDNKSALRLDFSY